MKNILIAVLALAFVVSCEGKKTFKDEDYKQQQAEYEKKKAELNKAKGEFYKANKQKLMDLVEIIKQLKDTTKSFGKISKDTSFFKDDVVMKAINFSTPSNRITKIPDKQNVAEAQVFFIHRLKHEASSEYFSEPFKELETCYDSKNDFPCIQMKEEDLQSILNLKYAFIVDDMLRIEPKLKSSSEFDMGLYFGSITCYDITNKKVIYSFTVTAQNSESVSSFEGGLESAIRMDFRQNIRAALENACLKHFVFE
jgi:hypothetical protein